MRLSETMLDVIDVMEKHNGYLIKYSNNDFWTYVGADSIKNKYKVSPKNRNFEISKTIPEWSCSVNTLRALNKRNLVILDEEKGICFLM